MKNIFFTKNLGRVIWPHPLKIDVKTSIASTFLPVTFPHKMRYPKLWEYTNVFLCVSVRNGSPQLYDTPKYAEYTTINH